MRKRKGGENGLISFPRNVATRAGNYFPWRFAVVQARDEQIGSSKVENGDVSFFPFSSNKGEEKGER